MSDPVSRLGSRRGSRFVAVLALYCAGAAATGLQVTPTSLTVAADRSAVGVWLSNTGDQPLHAQIRVYHWTQERGFDELVPSEGLIVGPPMVELEAGARQFVRVIRAGAPPDGREDAFRILVDELPIDEPAGASASPLQENAVHFVLRYSIPVFLTPAGADPTRVQLDGDIDGAASPARLIVRNRADVHAQLGNLVLVSAHGERRELSPGLLGYVLAGQTMHWDLRAEAAALADGAELQSRINGEPRERKVASLGPRRP